MSVLTVRIPEESLREMDHYADVFHLPRAVYIRQAIDKLNEAFKKKLLAERLKRASLRVRKESMTVNKEFSRIEYDSED